MNTLPPFLFDDADDPANVRRAVTRAGRGLRMTANEMGESFSAQAGGQSFPHPWKPALSPRGVTLSAGYVESLQARIGSVPVSGDPALGKSAPVLALDKAAANANGESWVCVEVTVDANGIMAKGTYPQIVHTNQVRSIDPLLGRCPLVLIVWQKGRPYRAIEGVYFNLRYARIIPPPASGPVRHIFY